MDTVRAVAALNHYFQIRTGFPSFAVTVGFDGFVDQIIEVVDKRYSATSYDRLKPSPNLEREFSAAPG